MPITRLSCYGMGLDKPADNIDWTACRTALDAGARALGVDLDPAAGAAMIEYLGQLAHWNRTHNLTAVRHPAAMVARHLLDSLAVLDFVTGPRVADIGSGAGLPGLVLAIADRRLDITLVEANRKKAVFLRHVRRRLDLHNVTVVAARAETWRPDIGFNCVICRALASAGGCVGLAGHLVAPGGCFLLMKGRDPAAELADLPPAFGRVETVALNVPGVDGQRHLVILRQRLL